MHYPLHLVHIDDQFIKKYAMADIPYIKAGDHIFVAMAKVNGCPLITSDEGMIRISKKSGVSAYKPGEFLRELAILHKAR